MNFRHLTFKEYKVIGEKYLREHPFGVDKLPTNIETLISKSGYIFESEPNLYTNYGVKGGVAKSLFAKNKYKIYVDQNHYENHEFEYKFTLSEELSHIILHASLYEDVKDLEDFIKKYKTLSDDDYKKFEQQAKCLASRLLLPQIKFRDFVLAWVDENITKLRKVSFFFSKQTLSRTIAIEISKLLSVSEYIIDISLNRYPDTIIDIILDKYGMSLIQ